jgi:mutator protein MutT
MPGDGSDRLYPSRPLAGVGAVVWNGAEVLLERRGRPPAQGSWAIPGGLIELGETAEEAVRREVLEECGIEVAVGPILDLFEPIYRDGDGRVRYHYVIVDFLAFYRSGELRVGDDAAEVGWVAPSALPGYELSPATRKMIERALAMVKG